MIFSDTLPKNQQENIQYVQNKLENMHQAENQKWQSCKNITKRSGTPTSTIQITTTSIWPRSRRPINSTFSTYSEMPFSYPLWAPRRLLQRFEDDFDNKFELLHSNYILYEGHCVSKLKKELVYFSPTVGCSPTAVCTVVFCMVVACIEVCAWFIWMTT